MDNPLLQVQYKVPFDRIKPVHVVPAIDALIAEASQLRDTVIEEKAPRTFENTMLALEKISERLSFAYGIIRHIESVATTPEFREEHNKILAPVSAFFSSLPLSEGLWNAVHSYSQTEEAKRLTGTKKRYLQVTVDDFKREGAELPPEKKARLAEINVELQKITTAFAQNVLDETKAFELVISDERQLAGLPPSAVEQARADAESKKLKGWRFTLQAPSYLAVMTYLDDAGIREKIYRAFNARGTSKERNNGALIPQILQLRAEKAKLLGFHDFADLALDDRMAAKGARAKKFLSDLRERVEPAFKKENEELQTFRRKLEGPSAPALKPWDVAYYAEKERKALYDFDEEELRPYFSYERVLHGMYNLVERLFGVNVQEMSGFPTWDPSVRTYGVIDSDGTLLGTFYSDFFPRESKRPGAWMNNFITGVPHGKEFKPHHGFIGGSFTPPVGDKPSLLTHREVETTFHEFGHWLHQCLSKVEIRSLSGTHVAWDFVELPSQIMENWCWEKDVLDQFATHYKTGEKIPQSLLDKMNRARNYRSANQFMRQLSFGTLDLLLHTEYDQAKDGEVLAYARRISEPFSATPLEDDFAMLAGFTHLFSSPVGYAAGYYSYKWAEVLDADAFTRFQKEGIFSRETGMSFRNEILSKGNSEKPEVLFRNFMGREPDSEALLRRSGIA